MQVALKVPGSVPVVETIEMREKVGHFEISSEKEPAEVELDPNTWVLMDAKVTRK